MGRDYIQRLAEQRFEGQLRNDFMRAIDKLTNNFPFNQIAELIEAGDLPRALRLVGLNPDAFSDFQLSTRAAFSAGATSTEPFIPPRREPGGVVRKAKIKVNFGGEDSRRDDGVGGSTGEGNPRAERAVERLNTSAMRGLDGGAAITEEGQRAVQNHIREGIRDGRNPRDVARDLRGRWDEKARAFRGGILGLTDSQRETVTRAEAQLRSGDPKELRKFMGRKLRDKRFDRTILKAIEEGTPIPEDKIRKMADGYRRKFTAFRAETVARDQTLRALSDGQEEALQQAIDQGVVREDEIRRDWITARDGRVRNHHQQIPAMNRGGRARGEPFLTPLRGETLRHPRDPEGSAANTIQCRCSLAPRIVRNRNTPQAEGGT